MKSITVPLSCIILSALVGCAIHSVRGSGPITLSKRVEQAFERYKNEDNPRNFAVSLDGEDYGYSFCPAFKCSATGQKVALDSCRKRSNGKDCKLYASRRSVIWDGPVSSTSDVSAAAETQRHRLPRLLNQVANDWSGARSDVNTRGVNVTFHNHTSEALSTYWIDFEGQRKFYGKIDPGREKTQSTYKGHRWELEAEPGKLLGRFIATDENSKAVVHQTQLPKLANQVADDWSGLRSIRNANRVNVTFRNHTSEALTVYWIDFEGRRKSYGRTEPGYEKILYTYEDHRWELEAESGNLLGRFVATDVDATAEVSSEK